MRDKPNHPLPGLESHLGYCLRVVSGNVSATFEKSLQSREISITEWVALRQLYDHEDISSGDLALLLGMTPGAVSKVLDKVEAKGLVARTICSADKRSQKLTLTLAGKHVLPQLAKLADENDSQYFGCLSEQERALLMKLLQKLAQTYQGKDVSID
jgi:DNA-binding MarR family transcriptional regulator